MIVDIEGDLQSLLSEAVPGLEEVEAGVSSADLLDLHLGIPSDEVGRQQIGLQDLSQNILEANQIQDKPSAPSR